MKKAVSLSLNTIIIAILVLLVLIVLMVVFSDKISIFSKGVSDCEAKGENIQHCVATPSECAEEGGVVVPDKCPDHTPTCCFLLNKQE